MALQSFLAAGNVTAPTALATIASCGVILSASAVRPELFEVNLTAYQTGTIDGNDSNAQLKIGSVVVGPVLIAGVVNPTKVRVLAQPGDTLLVQAIGNAGAGAIYNCQISATRIQASYAQ